MILSFFSLFVIIICLINHLTVYQVFAKGANAKITNPDAESICELHSWGIGPGQYVLYDDVMQVINYRHVPAT